MLTTPDPQLTVMVELWRTMRETVGHIIEDVAVRGQDA